VAAVVWDGDPNRAHLALRHHCQQQLPGFKIPDWFLVVSELPRTPSGKLRRSVLREMIIESPQ
jgi:acyl-CoA synthetase (AMP-forming)/AMP-acid ligase II